MLCSTWEFNRTEALQNDKRVPPAHGSGSGTAPRTMHGTSSRPRGPGAHHLLPVALGYSVVAEETAEQHRRAPRIIGRERHVRNRAGAVRMAQPLWPSYEVWRLMQAAEKVWRGTERVRNPSPSSSESVANLTLRLRRGVSSSEAAPRAGRRCPAASARSRGRAFVEDVFEREDPQRERIVIGFDFTRMRNRTLSGVGGRRRKITYHRTAIRKSAEVERPQRPVEGIGNAVAFGPGDYQRRAQGNGIAILEAM